MKHRALFAGVHRLACFPAFVFGWTVAGCGTIDHVDFPSDPDASLPSAGEAADAGGESSSSDVPDGPDGCTSNVSEECAGKCGEKIGRCGDPIDCGVCPLGLTCGGAGPNVCGTGPCTPSCNGKVCGASDGCGGICTAGACAAGQHCNGGKCVCDATSCSGCCSGSTCIAGTAAVGCGRGGGACVKCASGATCSSGVCAGCTPNCSGKVCGASDGCGGTCKTGACFPGQHCVSGACVCDATSCAGCCNGNSCLPGTTVTACGAGGHACTTCSGTLACESGTCKARGEPFVTGCSPLMSPSGSGCGYVCARAGATCVAKCGPNGNAAGQVFDVHDLTCSEAGQWDPAACSPAKTSNGRCCCE